MEITHNRLQGDFALPAVAPRVLWAACLVRRKAENRNLRNVKPMMVRIEKKIVESNRYSSISYNMFDMNNKPVSRTGNAYGTELHLFDTEQEANDYYNEQVGKTLDMLNRSIVKLEQEKVKTEALRIGR